MAHRPAFLWKDSVFQPQPTTAVQLDESDPEVKHGKTLTDVKTEMHSSPKAFETERLQRLSSWSRLKKVIALCLKLKEKLRNPDQSSR